MRPNTMNSQYKMLYGEIKMKKYILSFIYLGVLLLSGCVTHIDPTELYPIGKSYQGSVTLRGMVLPLPDGDWQVVGRGYSKNNNYVQLCLEKDTGNTPHSVILITRDTLSNDYVGYKSQKSLERKNILHVVSNSNMAGSAIDGWFINHMRLSMSKFKDQSDAIQQAYQHIIDNKLVVPGNFILTSHILTGKNRKNKFLQYKIFTNPEVEGFPPPINAAFMQTPKPNP